ncbi:MAG: BatA and WFA domain-containing protein [Pirellulales bacterium]|nr:BatA and WFA domain-containing protein [Pirellulales bacterium]
MFFPMLAWWQWLILGLIPPAIVALYFLKLRRQPLSVPSTLLWRKAIEDLHVNSFWQRLRQSLLLYLQVLFVLMLIFVLLRPSWNTRQSVDERVIFLIDNSASMGGTDQNPNRLAQAKELAIARVNSLGYNAVGMVLSFSDSSRVEQSFTGNKSLLRQAIEKIQPTQRRTNIHEALKQAAGLVNPGGGEESPGTDDATPLAATATAIIYSDGRFPPVQGFTLGNLRPIYVPVGKPTAKNLAITQFSLRQNEERPAEQQAFARIENFGKQPTTVTLQLLLDGKLWDKSELSLNPTASQGAVFNLQGVTEGELELRITNRDDLAVDDRAFAVLQATQPIQVLLVSAGNPDLERALSTKAVQKLARVRTQRPAFLQQPEYQQGALAGSWDLIIYDGCQPPQLPRGNTLFWGSVPPIGWQTGPVVNAPQVIDVDRIHPLSQNLDLQEVLIATARPLTPPAGATRLIDSNQGVLAAIAPRGGFEDYVISVPLSAAGEGYNTNWHLKASFPLVLQNAMQYFHGGGPLAESLSVQPGQTIELRQEGARELTILSPAGAATTVLLSPQSTFPYSATSTTGIYQAQVAGKTVQKFAVNLFDSLESNLAPVPDGGVQIGFNDIPPAESWQLGESNFWKWLLLAGLVLLLAEWYVYNRRVYV